MPRPVFDINEYELRGIVPEVYTEEQRALLNKTLARANGQIDWAAQMLGFNGPGYWGRPNPKKDGSYNWAGLPETMNEKRRMQAGAFGVYNKNLPYSEWPAPFNRSDIGASGDATIHVWERNGKTVVGPYGQDETIDYTYDPTLFEGATYIFDAELDISVAGGDSGDIFWSTTFIERNQIWTRVKIKRVSTPIKVKVKGSTATEAILNIVEWADPSDWSYDQIRNQFLGLWGNKGASPSFDAAFDSLDIHGFDERYGLVLNDIDTSLSLDHLLSRVGLEPTLWTPFSNTMFGIKVGGCDVVYPIPVADLGESYDNDVFPRSIAADDDYLNDGTLEDSIPSSAVVSEGIYEREIYNENPEPPDVFEFFSCEDDCNYTLALSQISSQTLIKGIGSIGFKYDAIEDCAKIKFPCIEWVFDPSLDNGLLEDEIVYPTNGPWATANDGEYDEDYKCFENVSQNETSCDGSNWCGFDDGVFDKVVEPNCRYQDLDEEDLEAIVDRDINSDQCILYDNDDFDLPINVKIDCILDNGEVESTDPVTATADSDVYDRVYTDCVECSSEVSPEVFPCPIDPIRVSLGEIFAGASWTMKPTISNSTVPLRLWKTRPLSVLDEVPAEGLTQYNFLVADQNQGPDELNAYRHFARLPLEYPRKGKFWNRTQTVCNNQSYFSAPPELSQTRKDPEVIRPKLYSEEYNSLDNKEYTIFYEEDYLTSTNTSDQTAPQEGFVDSQISFDDGKYDFAPALLIDFDPFSVRVPNEDGEWKGSYYALGINEEKTGYLLQDIETQSIKEILYEEFPTFDTSVLKLPSTEFPDSTDEASVKNYVVSYAYFAADFSTADDPVFDPEVEHCWRHQTIACSTSVETGNNKVECEPSDLQTNTAYLLHN